MIPNLTALSRSIFPFRAAYYRQLLYITGHNSNGNDLEATTWPTMTETEVVKILREHFEGLFPKVCHNCNRSFTTLREYILITRILGQSISYDSELGDWNTVRPIGSVAMANCPCGTTLALGTEGMLLPRRLLLLDWVRIETQQRGLSTSELLDHLRNEIRKQVLAESVQKGT